MANLEKTGGKEKKEKKKGGMTNAVNSTEKIRTWVSEQTKWGLPSISSQFLFLNCPILQ
jgi:hypothetical protein